MRIVLPPGLDERRSRGPDWNGWLDRVPRLYAQLLGEWRLSPAGSDLWHGACSLVAPVTTDGGQRAVLKLTFDGDEESRHEALALQHWHGSGAVGLLRADPRRRALLLEHLERRDLTTVGDLEACEVVAGLYAALHRPAPPQLARLTDSVSRWLDGLAASPRDIPIPPRYRAQALAIGRDLVGDPASVGTLVHGDLHFANVLAAPAGPPRDRGRWLVIDPKPMSADPHYELAPMLWHRHAELVGDVRGGIRRRFRVLVDHAGLDDERARAWVVVRTVLNAHWSVQDAQREGRVLSDEERRWITRCITVTKAVQD